MRVDNSTGKGTSGMNKFNSKVHRVHMELGSKLLNFFFGGVVTRSSARA